MSSLESHRIQIDKIDKKIIDLLNERIDQALKIARIKEEKSLPYYHPDREKLILQSLKAYNEGGFPNSGIEVIFREIISATRSIEKQLKVSYLGPPGSYTHLACLKHFGSSILAVPLTSINDVFKEIESNKVDYGVVPVENSYGGVVSDTLDNFIDSALKISSESFLQVSHCLLSNVDDISKIKKLYAHSQSFVQCRLWIENNLSSVEKVETSSNSKAASLATWDKFSAAIASEVAAQVYSLSILERNIQDSLDNVTRFLVIGKDSFKPTGDDKTSFICTINDEVGALVGILTPFEKRGLNLTKIESRPSRRRAWDYLFFIDIDAHISSSDLQEVLEELRRYCLTVKMIGSYPKGLYPER